MAEKKITIAEQYDEVINFLEKHEGTEGMRNFLTDRKEKHTARQNKPSKTATANSEANEKMKEKILAEMEKGVDYSVADLMKITEQSNQKVSYLMTRLKNDGMVNRIEKKGKVYYNLVE